MKELILLFIAFAIFLYGVFALLRDATKKIITVTAEIKKEQRKGDKKYVKSSKRNYDGSVNSSR